MTDRFHSGPQAGGTLTLRLQEGPSPSSPKQVLCESLCLPLVSRRVDMGKTVTTKAKVWHVYLPFHMPLKTWDLKGQMGYIHGPSYSEGKVCMIIYAQCLERCKPLTEESRAWKSHPSPQTQPKYLLPYLRCKRQRQRTWKCRTLFVKLHKTNSQRCMKHFLHVLSLSGLTAFVCYLMPSQEGNF